MAFGEYSRRGAWPFVMAAALAVSASVALAETRVEAAGRYAILRADDKDTGCMLTLESRPAKEGGLKAQLAPACRDNGLVVFDPVAWSLDHGRLSLVARKGHKAHFDREASGLWRRDAKEGKALSLRPM